MTDDELRAVAVPDVYQKSIFDIDYGTLIESGIRLITFDMDDTLLGTWNRIAPNPAVKKLVKELNKSGIKVAILTNAKRWARNIQAKQLGVKMISDAKKPSKAGFKKAQRKFGVTSTEMAHVGNSLYDDVVGGNRAGVTTCLVRNVGFAAGAIHAVSKNENRAIREELRRRKIWVQHHQFEKRDQYYQFGMEPGWKSALD